jgi:ABC-2 type transport system permease protein
MNTQAILALARNDLRLYLTDRRAVVIGVLVPIMLAAFFGYIFAATGGGGGNREAGKVPIAVVDEDQSTVSRAIAADLATDKMLDVLPLTREQASDYVKKGRRHAAAIFPPGFGEKSVAALFSGRDKPSIELLVDPRPVADSSSAFPTTSAPHRCRRARTSPTTASRIPLPA